MKFATIAALIAGALLMHATPANAYACNSRSYTNSDGQRVHSPSCKSKNFTAICRDGSYSHSRHHRGTCSRHGGVRMWR